MKKLLKSSIALIVIVVLAVSAFSFSVSAASASISFSPNKKSYTVGEQVTVTINFNAGTPVYSIDGSLNYNNAVAQYVSGGNNLGSSVKLAADLNGETSTSQKVTFKMIAEGSCAFSFSGFCTDVNLSTVNASAGATATVGAAAPAGPSANANLSSLKVSGATISPKFSPSKTSYTATVPFTTDKVTISATVADAGATVAGGGTVDLKVGANKHTLTVTAPSGAKKSYNITITRLPEGVQSVEDLLTIEAEGTTRKIIADISAKPVPQGFQLGSESISDIAVGILTEAGGKYTLYYTVLEDGSDEALFYKDQNGEYKRLYYLDIQGKFYIIEQTPDGVPPKGWQSDKITLNEKSADAYTSTNSLLKDFYVLYCYIDSSSAFYRYDSAEQTIQRAPDFELTPVDKVKDDTPSTRSNFFKTFMNMNNIGKIVIILMAVGIIALITLAVIGIMKFVKANQADEEYDDELITEEADTPTFEIEETEEITQNED